MSGLTEALKDWYPVAMLNEFDNGQSRETRLLGNELLLQGNSQGSISASAKGQDCKVQKAFDHYWVSLADEPNELFTIPEASESDRRFVPCGVVRVACSPLRAVENFLDIA